MKNLKINTQYNFSKKSSLKKKNKFKKALFIGGLTTSIIGSVFIYNNINKNYRLEKPKNEIIYQEPVVEKPKEEIIIKEPIVEVPSIEEPIVEVPTTEQPIVDIPTNEELVEDNIIEEDLRKQVALTFDDGPGKYTEKLLDALNENNVKATFFVVGTGVDSRPNLIKRMSEEGHLIGNHTYDHINFKENSIETIKQSIEKTNKLIENAGGTTSNLVRPPYGSITEENLKQLQYSFIMWSVDTLDWKTRDKEKVKQAILEEIEEGEIILLHDIHETTVDAIIELLPELTEEYNFVTVDQLFQNKDLNLENHTKYYKIK